MNKSLVINVTPLETRIALVEDGRLAELMIEREENPSKVGNIYRGRVDSVLATRHAEGGTQLTDDPARTAADYYRLYDKFSADILTSCGRATMARHYAHSGTLFLNAGNRRMAFLAYFKSLTRGWSPEAIPRMAFSLLPRFCQQRVRTIRQRL